MEEQATTSDKEISEDEVLIGKDEAAKILGVSTRAVERYAEAGKLTVKYKKQQRGGQKAVYVLKEVEALNEEMKNPKAEPKEPKENHPDTSSVALLSKQDRTNVIIQNERFISAFEKFVEHISKSDKLPVGEGSEKDRDLVAQNEKLVNKAGELVEQLTKHANSVIFPVEQKLILTLEEVAGVTSQSVGAVRKLVKEGKLKATKLNNKWRVKKGDLEEWVQRL
ncbi:MAG: helix-turn-helix domain-containing protein [Blastocatellia bacterium]